MPIPIAPALLLALLSLDAPAGAPPAVEVEGRVTYDGPIPPPVAVPEAAATRPLVEVDPGTGGLREAVVWLEGVPAPAGAGDGDEADTDPVVMDQLNFFFVPHVLAVRSGRPVEFRNSDNAIHGITASSLEPANQFNVTTTAGNRYTHRFRASRFPVAIGCPFHTAMAAWIFAFDHPWFAVTDDEGRFRLPAVPPGEYALEVRHPDGRLRSRRTIAVEAGKPCRVAVDLHAGDRRGADPR